MRLRRQKSEASACRGRRGSEDRAPFPASCRPPCQDHRDFLPSPVLLWTLGLENLLFERPEQGAWSPSWGDFLTVLQRLDSAIPDDLDGNTNKRRTEVRVLQEMQLLQVAAMNYRLRPLEKFVTYFPRMEQLSDKER
ncbi:PREDICTED: ral-GDS-related protein-like [Rhinopithecus bieti]|uniref:ral-GDS-related protein-like n=1 Tax=Rhinopithecus bieti TaxID=61621 RepID=UPI00083BC870|nr:PREDICTED: ral-GDS-related protein-like [Rhinopithecus bieti]